MISLLLVVHLLVALLLIIMVLIQDSKGGAALGIGGGGGSNSLLGATGAQTLAAKMTRWLAVTFAATCLSLTYYLSQNSKSVIDQMPAAKMTAPADPAPVAPAANPAPAPTK